MADVVIQAGHCFRKTGSTGTRAPDGDPTEQEVAWAVANLAASMLNDRGHSARAIVADPQRHEYRGDLFVAVHCDGSSSSAAHGASAGYRTDEGELLALEWKRQYARAGWVGFRADNYTAALQGYYGCRRAIEQGNRHACIVELGFLTNPGDEAQLASDVGKRRAAASIAAAVNAITGSPAQPQPEGDDDMDPRAFVVLTYNAVFDRNPETIETITKGVNAITGHPGGEREGQNAYVAHIANSPEAKLHRADLNAAIALARKGQA